MALLILLFCSITSFAAFNIVQTLQSDTANPLLPFGDGYGQTVKLNGNFLYVAASFARPSGPTDVVSGAIDIYHKNNGQWTKTQTIETLGEGDHDGALKIEAAGPWLMFSALGTPIGPITNDVVTNQDFKGSIQIYKLNYQTNQYEFFQSLDSNTPGLQNLTAASLASLDPRVPFFLNQQGASFGLNFSFNPLTSVILVGAEYQANTNTGGQVMPNSGAVYSFIFNPFKNKWVYNQTLTNPDGVSSNDAFGYNVVQNGLVALVSNGTFFQGPKLGPIAANSAVYVYNLKRLNWKFVQKITGDQITLPNVFTFSGSQFPMGDAFGESMDMSGLWAIIGAPLESKDPLFNSISGAVYFYKLFVDSDYSIKLKKIQKISSDDPFSYLTGFINIDISGNTAVISDPGRNGPASAYQGGAMVYQLQNNGVWAQTDTLYDPNGGINNFFGGGVSIEGNTIAVGGVPFGSIGLVALAQAFIGPPFHSSVLIPFLPLPNNPVIIYQNRSN